MKVFDVDERRARLVERHHLNRTGSGFASVADDIVAYHSSDPSTVYLAAWARIPGVTSADIERSLYVEREVLRLYGMRKTLFVVTRDVASVMNSACTRKLAVSERKRVIRLIENQGIATDGGAWIDDVSERVARALSTRTATARELREEIPELKAQVTVGNGSYGVSTRILFLMGVDGRAIRGKPRGSWLSSQYAWALLEEWAGEPLVSIDVASAQADLLDRWLTAFGPATERDMLWWTGWTKRELRRAMDTVGVEEVALDGDTGFVLAEDLGSTQPLDGSVAVLPSLDPTVMGWKDRAWYVGPHADAIFDRNQNAGPTVWADGRVVGGWAQRTDGRVIFEFLEPVDSTIEDRVEAETQALEDWLGDIRVTARFRTPLEARLKVE